jgi:predicted PurR-regulated permease PerM
MSDQAIISLIIAAFGAIGILVFYLISSIRTQLEETTKAIELSLKENNDVMIKKIEKFVDELSEVKEAIAVKSTMLDYMQREIETIKANCWKCAKIFQKVD